MKSIVIGTAGHIDHGKTALVKALTGIDADRLAEEKRRGITIDLGFAHLDLQSSTGETLHLGFVDVPGHERFVRNMLAGVGGIDLVLLVIAADESIKPQTREHFEILQLLGVQRGITVLTKSDAIDADTLDVVRLEVEDFLRGTFLEPPRSPIVSVSALTGAGLGNLKAAIISAAANVPRRDSCALARLPVDRVFTMKGFGTVVTGTLISGTIRREEELEVFPTGRRARVRGIQVHGHPADEAIAGQRTALNLAGMSTEDLSRGMTLAPTGTFESTRRADVQFSLLPSAPRALKHRARVHFHCNTMETIAEVALIGTKQLEPGNRAFARVKFAAPSLLVPGDRFIIRQFSPVITIGGGIILDAFPASRLAGSETFLEVLVNADRGKILTARIEKCGARGLPMRHLISETGWMQSALEADLAVGLKENRIVRVAEAFLYAPALVALEKHLSDAVATFHKKNSLAPGIAKEELRGLVKTSPEIFTAALDRLSGDHKIEILGDFIRMPGHGVVMKDDEAESKKVIENAFAGAGLKVPALNEVLSGLNIDKTRATKLVTLLLRDKVLAKISADLVFHQAALVDLRRLVSAQKSRSSTIDVATFKDLTGVSRKYAIPLLEYLDRERVTKRVGDTREIL